MELVVTEMKAISSPVRAPIIGDDEMATAETEVSLMKATIAAKFGVSSESVDLVTADEAGILRIRYATVFLTERDVTRIVSAKEG